MQFLQHPAPQGWQKVRDGRHDVPVPGDLIWLRRRQWRVQSAHAGDGLIRVQVEGRPSAESRTFLLPCDRWSRDVPRIRPASANRAMAWLAANAARVQPAFTPACIVTSRAEVLPYQLEPALAMLAGHRRILIADDVGLGKTIQAGLMIAETLHCQPDARVLVLVPASLLVQWSRELQAHFDLASLVADTSTFTRLRSDRPYMNNPWRSPGVWLASADYLKQPHVIDGMPRTPFDLLVVDEAHMMAGPSLRHLSINAIARSARRVILLTATPHDGDETRFKRLLSLGATGAPLDSLAIFRRIRSRRTRRHRRLNAKPGLHLSQVLAAIDSFERVGRPAGAVDGLSLICAVFRKRALSSLAALTASINRRLAVVSERSASEPVDAWTQPELFFDEALDPASASGDVISPDEWLALRGSSGLPAWRELTWLRRLLSLTTRSIAAPGHDPKLVRLTSLLRRTREPVVVFTEYRDSLLAIEASLARCRSVAVLHGGLTAAEQRAALGAFLQGGADTLLATDVASQGLNLQHRARWVVHFDLPWTPMRLEQRAGRVDRIGQSRPVHVTTIGVCHQSDATLRLRMDLRLGATEAMPLRNNTRWARAAEGLARLFARQRALAARWRGPDLLFVPRARVTAATLCHLGLEVQTDRRSAASPVTVVEIPFVTDTGEVLERWIGVQAPDENPSGADRLNRRARVLGARARRRLARLNASQAADGPAAFQQPNLFDAQLVKPGEDGTRDEVPALVGSAPCANEASVHIGPPRLLLLLETRE